MLRPFQGTVPKIGATVFIEDSAMIIGDVVIGDESSIWFHAVVRESGVCGELGAGWG